MVSIPFKREGTFRQAQVPYSAPAPSYLFQFPSNGKAHSDGRQDLPKNGGALFQFPSNGKAHSDATATGGQYAPGVLVSIPFKREGTFRQFGPIEGLFSWVSFNSLQTGRHIQTLSFKFKH